MTLRIAFVAGLSDKKLAQKLAPLIALDEVEQIDLYRRRRFEESSGKVRWQGRDDALGRGVAGELRRIAQLLLRGGKYDLLIGCHQRFHGYYAFFAGALHGTPVVQLTITDPAWIERLPGARTMLRRAAGVGFRGRTTLERHRRLHAKAAARQTLFALPNAWELPRPVPDQEKTVDVLYVGYLAGYKDIPTWLRTIRLLRRDRPDLRAVLVGEKPNAALQKLIDELEIGENLSFSGRLDGDALEQTYAASRLLLLTSRWEGLPQVALEAMAHGVPVVATDVGDVRDLADEESEAEAVVLIPPQDPEAAAEAVARRLGNEEERLQAAAAAKRRAEEEAAICDLESLSEIWRRALGELC